MISLIHRLGFVVFVVFWSAGQSVAAQGSQVRYHLDPENRAHHELAVTVEFTEVNGPLLEVRMSRSSPGRYALHEFAKNVYSVSATGAGGKQLAVVRANPHQWNIVTAGSRKVVFSYTLFADRVDGTYSAVDRSHLHLNGPATYAWARGFENRPIRVEIDLPENWQVATQLEGTERPNVFSASNLQALMDAPLEASEFWSKSWPVVASAARPARPQTVRVALHHLGTSSQAKIYAELVAAVVDEGIALYQDAPAFDHGTYTFLADYLPWASGDGMEHRNSTVLSSSRKLEDRTVALMGTVSHEFLHAWNIERIRPKSLEPFDFERANMAGELWFGEGFTSYYDDLILKRSGIISFESYVEGISRGLGGFLLAQGRRYRSPEQMSHQAPFVDAAEWIDRTNRTNNFISYYTYGAMLGVALDLELRAQFQVPLDQFMREVWRAHGVTEKPYTHADLQRILGEVASPDFARKFFQRFIHASETPDYASLLEPAGLLLVPSQPEQGWVGRVSMSDTEDGLQIDRPTNVGSPLYQAGLDLGDVVRTVGGETLDVERFTELVEAAAVGTTLEMLVRSRGDERTVVVTVAANPALEIRTFEQEDRAVSDAVRRFRESWLGKKGTRRLAAKKHCSQGGQRFDFHTEFCPWHGTELEPVLDDGAQ